MDLDAIVSNRQTTLRDASTHAITALLRNEESLRDIVALLKGEWIRSSTGTKLRRCGLVDRRRAPRSGLGSGLYEFKAVDGFEIFVRNAIEKIKHKGQRSRIAAALGFIQRLPKLPCSAPPTDQEREYFNRYHMRIVAPFIRFSSECRDSKTRERYLIGIIESLRGKPGTRMELRGRGFTPHQVRRCVPFLLKHGIAYTLAGGRIAIRREFLPVLDFHKSHLEKHTRTE